MDIEISRQSEDENGFTFKVSVAGHTYEVTLGREYYQKLTDGKVVPEELLRKSFEFLLEREGPGSILPSFDLPLINTYFPEYESEVINNLKSE
ncbi:MAG: hypothetical protein U5L95_04755 [Candidatus Saccharibacteria bacterium]|nr:hypothetical protein [Candidatus Saccharibacteria bacterium]